MKAFAPLLALFATAAALAAPATASADAQAVAYADLNGDHRIDRVTARPAPDNADEQILTATVGSTTYVARATLNTEIGVRPLRVVDLDHDGRQEVVVTEVVGANTLWFTVWGLNNGWRPVRTPDGAVLTLFEGGGISAISRYGCLLVNGHREMVTVGATIDWDTGIYTGELTRYLVSRGVATPTSRIPVTGDSATIGGMANPSTCA